MSLAEWQKLFQENILSQNGESKKTFLALIKHDTEKNVSTENRLGVYSDAYVLRLIEALRMNYPAIHQLLGDDYFDVMACRYLSRYPSRHASIRWFGDELSAFLKNENPYTNVPSIAELADFEWALRHTIDAADIEIVTPENLQTLAPESWAELSFSLHPSLTILKLDWNAPQILEALSNSQPGEPSEAQAPPAPVLQPGFWLVYRQPDLVSAWRSATPLEVAALESIFYGLNFADLCEELCNLVDDIDTVPLTAATFLRAWVEQGLLSLTPSIPRQC